MSGRGPFWCRECCAFVGGPGSRCNNCGHQHDDLRPALDEPIRLRRTRQSKRDGWEHLLGRRTAVAPGRRKNLS